MPLGILGGSTVGGHTNLARAAAVGGTTLEGESVGFANSNRVLSSDIVGTAAQLAGEIAPICCQRGVVERALAIGDWVAHDHMGVDHRGAQDGHKHRLGDHVGNGLFVGSTKK